MSKPRSQFILALCQPGAENALKAEVHRTGTGLKSSFQRKGLVTFKAPRDIDVDDALLSFPSVFARHVGLSLGAVEGDLTRALADTGARRLHVLSLVDDEQPAMDELRAQLVAGFREDEAAKGPELVATLVMVDGKPWLSLHRAAKARTPFPGGRPRLQLPAEAPSRAWLKLEEATRLFSIPFVEGQRAVEIGSAPGGAAWALLARGLEVVGVDPNDMDARVAAHPKFAHLKMTSMNVDAAALESFQWLLLDVNVPPRTALAGALPFLAAHRETLHGFVFTLKMKDWSLAPEVDDWLARIRSVADGFDVQARQLWSNGREICVVGFADRAASSRTERA